MTNLTGRRPGPPSSPYGTHARGRLPDQRRGVPSHVAGYDRPDRSRRPVRWAGRRRRVALIPWLFLAPALLLFVYFKLLPLLQAIKMSFYDVRPYLGDRYVGLGNY